MTATYEQAGKLKPDQLEELRVVFDSFDDDKSGVEQSLPYTHMTHTHERISYRSSAAALVSVVRPDTSRCPAVSCRMHRSTTGTEQNRALKYPLVDRKH